jgi:hypothetical protein
LCFIKSFLLFIKHNLKLTREKLFLAMRPVPWCAMRVKEWASESVRARKKNGNIRIYLHLKVKRILHKTFFFIFFFVLDFFFHSLTHSLSYNSKKEGMKNKNADRKYGNRFDQTAHEYKFLNYFKYIVNSWSRDNKNWRVKIKCEICLFLLLYVK